jgi:hypothetical protein
MLPYVPRQPRRGEAAAWPEYGRRARRRAGGRRPIMARGRRGVAGVQAARSTVQGTHTRHVQGLGLGARSIERKPASAFGTAGTVAGDVAPTMPHRRRRTRRRG